MHYVYATWSYSAIGCIFCSASFDTKAKKWTITYQKADLWSTDPGSSRSGPCWRQMMWGNLLIENSVSWNHGNCENGVCLLLNRHLGAAFAWVGVGFGSVSISNLRTHSGGAKGIWFGLQTVLARLECLCIHGHSEGVLIFLAFSALLVP